MKLGSYFGNLGGLTRMTGVLAVSNIVLSAAVLCFVMFYSSREVVTRIVPVGMTSEAEIATNSANAEYKRSIALFVASMTSNLQPQTAASVINEMSSFFEPAVYRDYREFALSVINDPVLKQANVVSVFYPTSVTYERTTDRVFVVGSQLLRGAGITKQTPVVYEMSVGVARGRPLVTYIKSYQGTVPETLKTLMARSKGNLNQLPESVQPLEMRSQTPDQNAAEILELRGDIDSQPKTPQQPAVNKQ